MSERSGIREGEELTKSINIFDKDFILIPIHANYIGVWLLYRPWISANSAERVETGTFRIIHLDSMGTNSALVR